VTPSPRSRITRLGDGVAHNFPSKKNTGSPERGGFGMLKDDCVFRLKRDDEVLAIASSRRPATAV